jgi:hypothetical protein
MDVDLISWIQKISVVQRNNDLFIPKAVQCSLIDQGAGLRQTKQSKCRERFAFVFYHEATDKS